MVGPLEAGVARPVAGALSFNLHACARGREGGLEMGGSLAGGFPQGEDLRDLRAPLAGFLG